jgi:hypothetical protein
MNKVRIEKTQHCPRKPYSWKDQGRKPKPQPGLEQVFPGSNSI